MTLSSVPNQPTICIKRAKDLSFQKLYDKMSDLGECSSNYKKCGDTNGKSKGVCVPQAEPCPITDLVFAVTNPNLGRFEETVSSGVGFSAFFTRGQVSQPLVETDMREIGPCYQPDIIPITPDREGYVLMKRREDPSCRKDERWIKLDFMSYGRKDTYDLNLVPYTRLPAFKIDNNQKLVRFHRKLIEWAPSCKNIVEQFTSQLNDLKKIDSLTGACHVIAWISFSVTVVFGLIEWFIIMNKYAGSEQFIRFYFWLGRFVIYIVQLALISSLYQRGKKIDGFYARIASEKCSDDFTNNSFTGFDGIINLHAVKRAVVTLIVVALIIACTFCYEAILHCRWLIFCGCSEVCGN